MNDHGKALTCIPGFWHLQAEKYDAAPDRQRRRSRDEDSIFPSSLRQNAPIAGTRRCGPNPSNIMSAFLKARDCAS